MILNNLLARLNEDDLISKYFESSRNDGKALVIKPKDIINEHVDFNYLEVRYIWATLEDEGTHIKNKKISIRQHSKPNANQKKILESTPDELVKKLTRIINNIFPPPPAPTPPPLYTERKSKGCVIF